jgi:hypothetical protein
MFVHMPHNKMTPLSILFTAILTLGATINCGRPAADDPVNVTVDLNKIDGVNVCPDLIPELPHANVDLTILLPRETPSGQYTVVVYRADPVRSVGQTDTITTEAGEARLRVKLNLTNVEPAIYTLAISTRPKVSYCDVRVWPAT